MLSSAELLGTSKFPLVDGPAVVCPIVLACEVSMFPLLLTETKDLTKEDLLKETLIKSYE